MVPYGYSTLVNAEQGRILIVVHALFEIFRGYEIEVMEVRRYGSSPLFSAAYYA
jgi:hypothetical protein